MIQQMAEIVKCKNCDEILDEPSDILPEQRMPCPSCGSKLFEVKSVKELILDLRSKRENVRLDAISVLGQIGEPAVPALIEALREAERQGRQNIAFALAQIGKPAVPALIEALREAEGWIRQSAAFALGRIGDTTAVPALKAALSDVNPDVRTHVASALGRIGDPTVVPVLRAALSDVNPDVRTHATSALELIGESPVATSIEALRHKDWRVPQGTPSRLEQIGDTIEVPLLKEILSDPNWRVRPSTTEALRQIGDSVVPALIEASMDKDWRVRQGASEALGEIGNTAAVPALIEILKDVSSNVRQSAVFALGQVGDATAVAALVKTLHDTEVPVRRSAALALEQIGQPAVHTLMEALSDEVWESCKHATRRLSKTGKPAVSVLIRTLNDEKVPVRHKAIQVLQKIVPDALDRDYLDSVDARLSKGSICTVSMDNEIELTLISDFLEPIPELYCEVGIKEDSFSTEVVPLEARRKIREFHGVFAFSMNYQPPDHGEVEVLITVTKGKHRKEFLETITCREPNPYRYGEPLRDEVMFYGREDLIQKITEDISLNSYALQGERRIGKTSLLYQLRNRLKKPFIPVVIDLEGFDEANFFLQLMNDIVNVSKDFVRTTPELVFHSDNARENYLPMDFKNDLRRIISQLKTDFTFDVKLVLLIDEIDMIRNFRMAIQQQLRSVFQTFLEVKAVIAGTLAEMDQVSHIPTSPFFNMFLAKRIKPLTEPEACELVTAPVKGQLTFTRNAVNFIIRKSERKPFYIQAICKHLVDAALKADRNKITLRDVKGVYESAILDASFAHCLLIWESIPMDLRPIVMKAANAEANGFKISKEKRIELRKLGLLDDASDSTLPPIFADWVSRNV